MEEKTQFNWVIGYPLTHTQSPLLHNTIYSLINCKAEMSAHATQNLSSTMQALKNTSTGLIAVTMPYKAEILKYLDNLSEEVKELKVANTVIFQNEKLLGYNTDVDGIAYALRDICINNKNVMIMGAGGAARAAAYFLNKNNANILWLNRTAQHALSLIEIYGGNLVNYTKLNELDIDIIINTTPVGMFPHIESSPLPSYPFQKHQIIFDMVYNPIDTLLLKTAKAFGATCISGLDMFIGQGVKQIELWLNQTIATPKLII